MTKTTKKTASKKTTTKKATSKKLVTRAERIADAVARRVEQAEKVAKVVAEKVARTSLLEQVKALDADGVGKTTERRHSAGRRAADQLVEQTALESAHHLEQAQEVLAGAAKELKAKVKEVAKVEKAPRVSISATADALIQAGKTDEEVLAALVAQHGLDPVAKKHYPSWFRARLVRGGTITQKFADEHRHSAKAEA